MDKLKKKKLMSDMVMKPKTSPKKEVEVLSRTTPPPRKASAPPLMKGRISDEEEIVEQEQDEDILESSESEEIELDYFEQEERSIDQLVHHYGDKPKGRFGCVVWIIAFIAIIAIVFVVGGLFTHATIVIGPKTFTGTVDDSITLSQTRSATTIQIGMVTKDFTSQVVIPATGRSATDTKATGTVRFYNSTTTSKTIPSGTIIISSKQVEYATNKSFTIPKAASSIKSGQVDAVVTAVNAGDTGNDALDDFTFAKPTASEKLITIHSTTVISGGASGNESTADPMVLAQAEQTVKSNLADQNALVARLTDDLPDNSIALPLVIPLADPTITIDGTQNDGVHVVAHRTVSTFVIDKSAIATSLGTSLNVPQGTDVVLNSWNGLTVTSSDVAQGGAIPQTIHVRITGTATLVGNITPSTIVALVAGQTRSQTRTILNKTPEIISYTLSVTPPWRRLLPTDPSQITVVIKPISN